MDCLHCGDCCRRMSPISAPAPCPHIVERDGFTLCGCYDKRPPECANHTFHARFCPVGMGLLQDKLTSVDAVRRRIDRGWELCQQLAGEQTGKQT